MGQRAQPLFAVIFVSGDCFGIKSERKEGQTSSQHGPYTLGYTHVTMGSNNGYCQTVRSS